MTSNSTGAGGRSDDRRFDVFLSYNSRARPQVERIAARLKRAGLEPWLDRWWLTPGGRWQEELPRGLAASSACAVFVGPEDLGAWERAEVELALDRAVKQRGFRVFPVLLPGLEPFDPNSLPPFLRTRTWVDFRPGVESGRPLEDLIRAVKGVPFGPDVALQPRADVCPYRGLQVFEEQHAEFFFGRDAEVQRLLERLKLGRFVAVVGASGSGKSSLARAGLVPALRGGRLPGSEQWTIAVFRPGGQPLATLAAQLLRLSGERAMQHTVDNLAGDRRSLDLAVTLALAGDPPERRVVLVVDQLEELFTLCRDEQERQRLVDNLVYAATVPGGQTTIILTLRADFYPRLARYPELAQLVQTQQLLVAPLDDDGLRQAIEQPAFGAGLEFEAGLVDTVLADVARQPGALPLLEHALLETWRRRRGATLTLEGYRASGGVDGALSERAEQIYKSLTAEQQTLARRLLLRLTEPGEGTEDTRRRARLDELVSAPGERGSLADVLRDLTDARLLTTSGEGDPGERWVDVSHEALIRGWPRLQAWIAEDRAGLRTHRQLTDAADQWKRLGRDRSALYRGARLAEAVEWRQRRNPDLNQLERDFLTASEASQQDELRRERRRVRNLRALTLVLVALLLGAVGAVFVAARQTQNAHREARAALSRALAEQALTNLDSDVSRGILLALEAYHRAPTVQARNALVTSVEKSEMTQALPGIKGLQSSIAFSPDGATLASAGAGGVRLFDVGRRRQLGKRLSATRASDVAFSPDGKLLASAGDGGVRLWDVETRRQLGKALSSDSETKGVAFSPDGHTLASASFVEGVRLWDVASRRQLGEPLRIRAFAVAFSPDGVTLASAGDGVRLWDIVSRRLLGEPLSAAAVSDVAFSSNGATVASVGDDGVRLWDVASHRQLGEPLSSGFAASVAFSPDGKMLASAGSGGVRLWDVASRRQLGKPFPAGFALGVAFSADDKTLASANDGVQLWDLTRRRQLGRSVPGAGVRSRAAALSDVAFSPDGETLASAGYDDGVRLFDVASRRQLGEPLASGFAVAFSPDGKTLASIGARGVRLWDVASRRQLGKPFAAGASGVAFSPDGKTLASYGSDGVRRWDIANRRQLGKPFSAGVITVAFSPDGKTLAFASNGSDGVRLWDIASHQPLGKPFSTTALDVAFSADGKRLASASLDGVRLWNAASRRALGRPFSGEADTVEFSRDGETLASASPDGVRLWDATTRRQLGTPLSVAAYHVAFSRDGTLASRGRQLVIWPRILTSTREEAFARHLCRVVRRDLTQEEWAFYLPGESYRKTCSDAY